MLKLLALLALLSLLACNSPKTRLQRLQHEFWEKFARQDFFDIQLRNEVLHLPLPPAVQPAAQQKSLAAKLRKEAGAINKEKLTIENQKQLAQLQSALDDYTMEESIVFFDPARCIVTEQLALLANHPDLPVFLEKVPVYYAQIEQRWQTPDVRYVAKAVSDAQITLDLLHELEHKMIGAILHQNKAAQLAVKDFIGLCQSALLK